MRSFRKLFLFSSNGYTYVIFSHKRNTCFFRYQNKRFPSGDAPGGSGSPLSFWRSSFKSGPASMKTLSDTGFLSVRLSLLVFTMAVQFSSATSPFLRKRPVDSE